MERKGLQGENERGFGVVQVLVRLLVDPADRPAWIGVVFRLLPAQVLTAIALLAGCMNTPANVGTPTGSAVWETVAPGLERRYYHPGGDYGLTQFIALRIDPLQYTFSARYRPGAPLNITGWRDALPGAVAFINANYFDPENHALGLVVADGVPYGQAYQGIGGMLQVQNGGVRVRSTILEPYAGETLEQAVQAFPMLMTNGQASFANTQGDRSSRRTVVGQDTGGRIVLITTSSLSGIKLVDLSQYLASTDLQLVNAVNLDGGGSTLLALTIPNQPSYFIPSFDPVPTVLAVYPR
jgi:Phosphodiester glycosidase